MLVDNEPGVLARVIGLFSGRGYNIDSLTVSETEHEKHLSRITIVTRGTPMVIEQIKNQLERLVPIHRVIDIDASPGRRSSANSRWSRCAARARRASRRCDSPDAFRRPRDRRHDRKLRVRDHRRDRQDRAVSSALMLPFGLVEVSRTGVVAIAPRPRRDVDVARHTFLALVSFAFVTVVHPRP